ncbi:MAG: dihydrolipoamide acetyltransferase family protein, partial [Solirubrobacteraceae bacterium]
PRLSDSMEQGTILNWLVTAGEPVQAGQDLVEIETDKATIVCPAETSGVLEILVEEGATVTVGAPIARIGAAGTARQEGTSPGRPAQQDATNPVAPRAEETAELTADAPAAVASVAAEPSRSAGATPLARRAARMHGVELTAIAGSGPRGRVTRSDVFVKAGIGNGAPTRRPQAPLPQPGTQSGKGAHELLTLTRAQQLIARRMAESKATIPHFQVSTEVAMDRLLEMRSGFAAIAAEDAVPSLNALIVKAAALALRSHPRANGAYEDGGVLLNERINIGVAVAAEDLLLVPVVMDADTRSLSSIARESRRLIERARTGTVTPAELSGATFTVTNLGMYGMSAITPVVTPGQAAILGVGGLRTALARSGGEVVERTLMTATLSCDHRVLYGADAARLLADIRSLLEQPLGLTL